MWLENKKHCRTDSLSLLKEARRLRIRPFPGGAWTKLPCRTKTWFTSSRISQPSTIIRSTARFLRRFSVSETSSCICLPRANVWVSNELNEVNYLLRSSSCCLAFCKLLRSTWSWGVWASSSWSVMMYRGIWCIGYVKKVSNERPWHCGLAKRTKFTLVSLL